MVGAVARRPVLPRRVVVRGPALRRQVVGVEAQVSLAHLERDGDLSRRHPADRRHPQLDHEPAAGSQVPGRVAEALDLLLLRAQVGDRVPDQVDERELAGHPGRRHVAHDDRDGALVDLAPQLRDHRCRELDPRDRYAASGQGDRDPTGPDGELERRPGAGQPGQEVDGGIEYVGRELLGRALVVALRRLLVPQVAAHHGVEPDDHVVLLSTGLFASSWDRRRRPAGLRSPVETACRRWASGCGRACRGRGGWCQATQQHPVDCRPASPPGGGWSRRADVPERCPPARLLPTVPGVSDGAPAGLLAYSATQLSLVDRAAANRPVSDHRAARPPERAGAQRASATTRPTLAIARAPISGQAHSRRTAEASSSCSSDSRATPAWSRASSASWEIRSSTKTG